MLHVVSGTDTYGRVKTVGKTPIITKFEMLHFIPLVPIRSYYLGRLGPAKTTGIPFLMMTHKVKVTGIPLARIDWLSVRIAYVRALFAVLFLLGLLGSLLVGDPALIISLQGGGLDEAAWTFVSAALVCLGVAVVGGGLTYLIPTTTRRERAIRQYCGELLGMCIDPARVTRKSAGAIREFTLGIVPQSEGESRSRQSLIRDLILVRCQRAEGAAPDLVRATTDELLAHLERLGRVAP
jgi:hypothetical protein